jgi:CspA family cold shock protein
MIAVELLAARASAPAAKPSFAIRAHSAQGAAVKMKERPMTTGTVKWFNATKGYGFIAPDDGGTDVFLHISAVESAGLSSPNEGDKLSFELEKDSKSGKMSAGKLQRA